MKASAMGYAELLKSIQTYQEMKQESSPAPMERQLITADQLIQQLARTLTEELQQGRNRSDA